ncbi:MAG: FAD:protein FMN transferase [Pseudomonadota bacterium]
MGSPCELKVYLPSKKAMEEITGLVVNEVRRFEEKYTRFKSTSITSQINNSAGRSQPISVDHETARLLDYADVLYQQSDGLFDITSGVLRKAWDFKSQQLPSLAVLKPLLEIIGWSKVIWHDQKVQLPQGGMEIDFGGFVKEYAADVVSSLCRDQGVVHGLINLGGDVKIIGPHPDGSPWAVGIQHPRQPSKPIALVNVWQGGIATSGDYERFMTVNGVRYCHLLNPTTGHSIQPAIASASVIADTCLIAGSFSTIAMLKSQNQGDWLDSIGLPYLQVDQNMALSGTVDLTNP